MIAVALVGPGVVHAADPAPSWRLKVDPWVMELSAAEGRTEFLVFLTEQADLAGAADLRGKAAKGSWVVDRLREVAARTQAPLRRHLEAVGAEHRPFWVANMLWVRGDRALIEELARRADVAHLYANPKVALQAPVREEAPAEGAGPDGIEPNLVFVGVPDVYWNNGFTGQGVVVGIGDTGQKWDHEALRPQYRGWNGNQADHNYNWHDSIHSGGGSCGANSQEPCDDFDHGTHAIGISIGDDGGSNQIGMAPGAKWIGCRNMNVGFGTPASYTECFEFFMAPTDLAGNNPDPSLAADVINNSWTCPPSEGCVDPDELRTVVENVRAAGIVVVASAGNSGPSCSSLTDPPAIYDASLTVGATNNKGEIVGFSARGSVTVDGSGRTKPDITAPGQSIRSSVISGGYSWFSGTSMAGPHVAGLVALEISAQTCLKGNPTALEAHMEATTLQFDTLESCGGVPGNTFPNNTYGWGIIQAELPGAGLCDADLGGNGVGVAAVGFACRNVDSGQTLMQPLGGEPVWSCLDAGLTIAPGETVGQALLGEVDAAEVGGSVVGMSPLNGRCRNMTTGDQVPLTFAGETSWSCTDAGLAATVGDRVLQMVLGTAD